MLANFLVQLLTVAALLHRVHHNVLGSHKGKFTHQAGMDHLGIHHQPGGHIDIQVQNSIRSQECLGHADPLVGGVVQCAFKPLGRGCPCRVQSVDHHIAGQRSDPLTAHGIALISHSGGTDLILLKGLLNLFQILQQPQVVGKLAAALSDQPQAVAHNGVQLAGIGLAADREAGLEAHLLCDLTIQRLALLVVAVKQLQETGLGAGGALRAQQHQGVQHMAHLFIIHDQIHQPQSSTLAHGGGLSRLEVGKAQAGHILILVGKLGHAGNGIHQLFLDQQQGLPHGDHICIIAHIARGGTQVDNGLSRGALHPIGIYMAHYIMAHQLLPFPSHIVVNVLGVRFQLVDLCLSHIQPQLVLRFCQSDPQLPPGFELKIRGVDILHFFAGIARVKGRIISICLH